MKLKKYLFFGIILIVTLIACRDLFRGGYFSMHDDLQIGRLYEMDLCFRDGQIPCRWVPDMGYSYGYPLFNYYPPFPFYLGEIFHLLGLSFIISTKILFGLGFLVSGILMFLFGRKLWGDWGGLLSAVLYIFAPYHSVDVYVRGAMNEHWAVAFFPGVCWAIYEIVENDKKENRIKFISLLALFFGFLLLSHNLMALIFTPVAVIFAFLLIWLKKKKILEKIIDLGIGGLWGVGLAAFFTLPVILEKKYVHVETMLMGYFNYLAHYVPIGKLLFTRFWGYGSSGWLQQTGMPFQVGLPQWPLAMFALAIGIYLFVRKKIKLEKPLFLMFFFLIFAGSLFLVHSRSVTIWNSVSLLAYLQFPWRFLTVTIFAMAVLGGGIVVFEKRLKWQKVITLVLVITTVLLNFSFFRIEKQLDTTDTQKLFSAKGWNKLQTDAIFDYLPVYAKAPPAGPAPKAPEVMKGKAQISDINKGTDWYKFKVNASESAQLQVPVYDFAGWKATVNGKKSVITHDNFLGLITITVPPGESNVSLKLTNTPIRLLGNILTLVSWVLLLLVAAKNTFFQKRKK